MDDANKHIISILKGLKKEQIRKVIESLCTDDALDEFTEALKEYERSLI